MSMNAFHGIGRITRDLHDQIRYTRDSVAVVHFTVAIDRNHTNRNGDRSADFVRCEVWGYDDQNGADNRNVQRLVDGTTKGSRLGVSGRIQTGRYLNNGQYVYTWGVRVNDYTFLDPKPQGATNGQGRVNTGQARNPFDTQRANRRPSNPSTPRNPFDTAPSGRPNRRTNSPAPSNRRMNNQSNYPRRNNRPNNRPSNPNPAPKGNRKPKTGKDYKDLLGSGNKKLDISDDDLPF